MKKLTPIFFSVLLLIITSMVAELAASSSSVPIARRYDSIFSFGDSFADTGNDIVVFAAHSLDNPTARPPYGMTFFGHPTGRNSNGRLIIDFIGKQSTLLATSLVFVCDVMLSSIDRSPGVCAWHACSGEAGAPARAAVAGAQRQQQLPARRKLRCGGRLRS
jgi:hypothetical protein